MVLIARVQKCVVDNFQDVMLSFQLAMLVQSSNHNARSSGWLCTRKLSNGAIRCIIQMVLLSVLKMY